MTRQHRIELSRSVLTASQTYKFTTDRGGKRVPTLRSVEQHYAATRIASRHR